MSSEQQLTQQVFGSSSIDGPTIQRTLYTLLKLVRAFKLQLGFSDQAGFIDIEEAPYLAAVVANNKVVLDEIVAVLGGSSNLSQSLLALIGSNMLNDVVLGPFFQTGYFTMRFQRISAGNWNCDYVIEPSLYVAFNLPPSGLTQNLQSNGLNNVQTYIIKAVGNIVYVSGNLSRSGTGQYLIQPVFNMPATYSVRLISWSGFATASGVNTITSWSSGTNTSLLTQVAGNYPSLQWTWTTANAAGTLTDIDNGTLLLRFMVSTNAPNTVFG